MNLLKITLNKKSNNRWVQQQIIISNMFPILISLILGCQLSYFRDTTWGEGMLHVIRNVLYARDSV